MPAESRPDPATEKAMASPRQLPSPEQIGSWVEGDDLPTLSHLFDQLNLARFDALTMQIRKEELVPQHWQVISRREIGPDVVFETLPAVRRLREAYIDNATAESRVAALAAAWRELGGKQPSLWTVADLLAAMRRLIAEQQAVDFHSLLSAIRDIWAGMTLPHGRTQLGNLRDVLTFVREKTKK